MSVLTVNDTAPALTGTVNAVITGATLAIHIQRPSGAQLNKVGTIVSGPDGTWSCAWTAGDLSVAGAYLVEVQVTYAGGTIQTFALDSAGRPASFTVRDELA